jgi:hypothetical protein
MKYIIPILLLVLSGCANNEEYATSSGSAEVSTSPFITSPGTKFSTPQTATKESKELWKTECYVDSDNYSNHFQFTYVDNSIFVREEQHSDANCLTDYALQEETHTYNLISEKNRFLITIGSITKRTPQSVLSTNSYNSDNNCDYDDWKLNIAKDCTNEKAGDVVYCYYQFNENILYLACDSTAYPTSADSTDMIFTKQ